MTSYSGSCQCGSVSVSVAGDARIVSMCFCKDCQRRTGSPGSVHAYYPEATVTVDGDVKLYSRPGDSGCLVNFHFCPNCGSTMFWTAEASPGQVGVPVGLFADPRFPPPTNATFVPHKYPWFTIPEGVRQNETHSERFLAGVAAALARRRTE